MSLISDDSVLVGQSRCVTAPRGTREIRIMSQAFSGFTWVNACNLLIRPVVQTTVTMRGTTFHPTCTR